MCYDEPTISELCGALWLAIRKKLGLTFPWGRPKPSQAALDVHDLVQLTLKDLSSDHFLKSTESITDYGNIKKFFEKWEANKDVSKVQDDRVTIRQWHNHTDARGGTGAVRPTPLDLRTEDSGEGVFRQKPAVHLASVHGSAEFPNVQPGNPEEV